MLCKKLSRLISITQTLLLHKYFTIIVRRLNKKHPNRNSYIFMHHPATFDQCFLHRFNQPLNIYSSLKLRAFRNKGTGQKVNGN